MPRIRYLIAILAGLGPVLGPACGGSSGRTGLASLPAPVTRATLAGPLCEGATCRCREPGDDVGKPPSGAGKRYEIRMGPIGNEQWVMVDDMVLYKDAQQATACFYVDLGPGEHSLRLQAQGRPGFDAALSVSEMRPAGEPSPTGAREPTAWYDTFVFSCGAPGHCDLDQLRTWHASLSRYRRQVHDPCGATRIRGLAWQTGDAPDGLHPSALQLDLVLDVYSFAPEHGPGHPACADDF